MRIYHKFHLNNSSDDQKFIMEYNVIGCRRLTWLQDSHRAEKRLRNRPISAVWSILMSATKKKYEAVSFRISITPSIMMYNEQWISEEFQFYCLHPSQSWCRKWHRTCIWRYPYRREKKHRRSIPTLGRDWWLISASIALLRTCKLSKLSEHGIFYDCIWSFYNGRRWYFFNSKNRAEISVPVHPKLAIFLKKTNSGAKSEKKVRFL